MTIGAPAAPRASPSGAGGLSPTAGFWLTGMLLGVFLAATAAVSPLYPVYQQKFGFSPVTLTGVFAIYSLALLLTLLFLGGLSDTLGRRRMLLLGVLLELLCFGAFLFAPAVGWLFGARFLQGAATGIAQATIGAVLLDLEPPERPGLGPLVSSVIPPIGLAVGGLGSGLLVQYAPFDTTLVFVVLAVCTVVGAVAVRGLPETVQRRAFGFDQLRPRIGLPVGARSVFLATAPCLVATWGLGGLYLSLGPSLAQQLSGGNSLLIGGWVIFLLNAAAAAGNVWLRHLESARLMIGGCLVLVVGVLVTTLGLGLGSGAGALALLLVGTFIAGAGFGATFLGAYRTLVTLAPPTERGRLISLIFVLSYTSFSVPALAAGVAAREVGLRQTAIWYSSVVVLLALASAAATWSRRAAAQRSAALPAAAQQAAAPPSG
jgi:MFS family permease